MLKKHGGGLFMVRDRNVNVGLFTLIDVDMKFSVIMAFKCLFSHLK